MTPSLPDALAAGRRRPTVPRHGSLPHALARARSLFRRGVKGRGPEYDRGFADGANAYRAGVWPCP